jgi:hypothetical protein
MKQEKKRKKIRGNERVKELNIQGVSKESDGEKDMRGRRSEERRPMRKR